MEASDWIALASAAAAGGSWIWAIKQTRIARQASASSQQANQLSDEANRLSGQANVTAAQALTVSAAGALDARKARLATGAPNLAVTPGNVEWPPLRQSLAAFSPGSPWPHDHIFRTPRDDNERLGLRFPLTVRNIGTDTEIVLHGSLSPLDPRFEPNAQSGTRIALAAGESAVVAMEMYEPLRRWIADHRGRVVNGYGEHDLRPWIRCDDGRDEGVICTISVSVPLAGLEYIEEETGSWRFPNAHAAVPGELWPPTRPGVAPMELQYFESKINGKPLEA